MATRHMDLLGRYTVLEAAQRANLHPNTLRKYIKDALIPGAEKLGGRYVIRKDLFDAWVIKGERPEAA